MVKNRQRELTCGEKSSWNRLDLNASIKTACIFKGFNVVKSACKCSEFEKSSLIKTKIKILAHFHVESLRLHKKIILKAFC